MESYKKISLWFPTLIYEDFINEFKSHNLYLESKAYEIQKNSSEVSTTWKCDTYNTLSLDNVDLQSDPIIERLINICKDKVIDFAAEYGIKKSSGNLECIDCWLNIAEPGNYQEYHIHPKSDFSLVYYIKTGDNCGNIIFQNKDSQTDMFPLDTDELTYASYSTCFYTPKDSLLLIFRSSLPHMVEKNLSNKDRISIAMNFKFKESNK
jgi:uncharacterized protein (TIGR02466 family)